MSRPPTPEAGEPVLRTADGDDLTAVVDIGRRTWRHTFAPIAGDEYVEMGLAKWWTQEATIPAIRTGRVTVAQLGDELVGMSTTGTDRGALWLWKLYVLPEHQGRGIGSRLLASAVERARGTVHDELWVSHLEPNEQGARFYHRHGFEPVRREQSGSGIPDSLVLRLDLTALAESGHDHPSHDHPSHDDPSQENA